MVIIDDATIYDESILHLYNRGYLSEKCIDRGSYDRYYMFYDLVYIQFYGLGYYLEAAIKI